MFGGTGSHVTVTSSQLSGNTALAVRECTKQGHVLISELCMACLTMALIKHVCVWQNGGAMFGNTGSHVTVTSSQLSGNTAIQVSECVPSRVTCSFVSCV